MERSRPLSAALGRSRPSLETVLLDALLEPRRRLDAASAPRLDRDRDPQHTQYRHTRPMCKPQTMKKEMKKEMMKKR